MRVNVTRVYRRYDLRLLNADRNVRNSIAVRRFVPAVRLNVGSAINGLHVDRRVVRLVLIVVCLIGLNFHRRSNSEQRRVYARTLYLCLSHGNMRVLIERRVLNLGLSYLRLYLVDRTVRVSTTVPANLNVSNDVRLRTSLAFNGDRSNNVLHSVRLRVSLGTSTTESTSFLYRNEVRRNYCRARVMNTYLRVSVHFRAVRVYRVDCRTVHTWVRGNERVRLSSQRENALRISLRQAFRLRQVMEPSTLRLL